MKFWFARSFLQQFRNVPFVSDLHGFTLELCSHSHPFLPQVVRGFSVHSALFLCFQFWELGYSMSDRLSFKAWPCCTCRAGFSSQPGAEAVPPAVEVWGPNHWATSAFPSLHMLLVCFQVHWLSSLTFLCYYWSHPVSFKIFSYCTLNYKIPTWFLYKASISLVRLSVFPFISRISVECSGMF